MNVQTYIDKLNTRYHSGITTEHSFRGDLQNLLEAILPDALITNEPTRIKCGAPDYIITKRAIPVGYIEAKDLGADLDSKLYKEQFKRYRDALPNLIITNYLDFQVYKDGELVTTISIGAIEGGKITGNTGHYDTFAALIKDFSNYIGQTIRSAQKLAVMMANKAKMLADVIHAALDSDEENSANSTLQEQLKAFKDILIHDITAKDFADIYAQTIAYGMFAARLHDHTLESFTRQEAAELIPKTNPFLRKLFQYIAGYDLDGRIVWIVDALADIFRATDVAAMLKNFGKATRQHDPIIHFYETFLSEYDPKLRKSRGVWYTPEPVVNFIVRAVDDILKTEFGLKEGLADTSKVKIKRKVQSKATPDQRSKLKETEIEEEVHRVQILDPATGTGTFLAEVIKQIHEKFEGQQGIWSKYVEKDLIPRLNGFELLMASYAMAHLKLELLLTETGYKPKTEQRLRVYLTNSLEEHHPDTGTLFSNWLSSEANEANQIKRDVPVMVVLGNPPYSGESSNKGKWIMEIMEKYKKEPGGVEKLKERNPKWINDDYAKFIRYGQYYIEKAGEGILAYINNHAFIDNPTFRGMRWDLANTFDKIYILDLHGNVMKKEISPDNTPDKNVFDIQQGVSINLFIKTGKKKDKELAKIFHSELWGKREIKYEYLIEKSVKDIPYKEVELVEPFYFFIPKDFTSLKKYNKGISIADLFINKSVGIVTSKDEVLINPNKDELMNNVQHHYKIEAIEASIHKISYRPFDNQYIYYDTDIIERARFNTMRHLLNGANISLIIPRQAITDNWSHVQVTQYLSDNRIHYSNKGIPIVCPLYNYPDNEIFDTKERTSNLDEKIVIEISKKIGLTFTNEKEDTPDTFAPIDLLDYIYAVLHSFNYREKYKEFLKIEFPHVPYPTDKEVFWLLVNLGGELRQIHLLESPVVSQFITKYPIDGTNIVDKPSYRDGKVCINSDQYFEGVPEVAWEFYIGGYQPAQKWLKDRKDRELSIEDIMHYQKIIVALTETDRIMKEIDKVDFLTVKP